MWLAAIAVAAAFWGPPQPACTTVAYHVAELDGPLGVFIDHGTGYCEILVKAKRWRWGELCHVLVHEQGHAAGRGHSEDPLDVMFPVYWRTTDVCRGKRPAEFRRGQYIHLSP